MGIRLFAVGSAALLASVTTGCALSHERGGGDARVSFVDSEPPPRDGGPRPPDGGPPPVDAFLRRDAWSPTFTVAPHGPLPIVTDQGGRRMHHPQLVVITYADDVDRAAHEGLTRWAATSDWLATVGGEYGIDGATLLGVVERTDRAPSSITDEQIAATIRNGIANGTMPVPAGGVLDDALYILHFPPGTTITDDLVGRSCETFGGYHNESQTADGRLFAYAVVPSCPSASPDLSDLANEQVATTHEIFEAATDPLPFTAPGWAFGTTLADYSPWLFAGAELADLCEYRLGPAAYYREGGFTVTRIWSNAAARRGDVDPCVPWDGAPYGTVTPAPGTVQFAAPGSTVTFDLAAWSTASMPSFQIGAFASSQGAGTFMADVFLDRSSVVNGDHATLTVTVPFDAQSQDYGLVYILVNDVNGNVDYVPVVVVAS